MAELVNEEAVAHLGTPIWSTEQVLRHWRNPIVDRERDVAVVEAPGGEICGWLSLVCGPPHVEVFALGVVAPAWHGRGLGAAILAECERRAARFLGLAPVGARVVIHAGALADEPTVGALLTAAGYREVRRFQLMRIDFPGELPAPTAPAGIHIEQVDPERDVVAAFDAHREAFADHWGEMEETLDEFRHWLIETPRFDRELSLLARDGPDVAGYLFAWPEAEEDPSRGYVAALGTRRAYRGRGIAEALLRHVFRTLLRPRQARLRPPRRLGFVDGCHPPLRARRHDRAPTLRHLGEGVAPGRRPWDVSGNFNLPPREGRGRPALSRCRVRRRASPRARDPRGRSRPTRPSSRPSRPRAGA